MPMTFYAFQADQKRLVSVILQANAGVLAGLPFLEAPAKS